MTQFTSDIVVFDLDDTLYKEVSFVESGFKAVAGHLGDMSYAEEMMDFWSKGQNAFEELRKQHSIGTSVAELLDVYRFHIPSIQLDGSTILALDTLVNHGKTLGIITDGRTRTQRNKIETLGLYRWFSPDNIIISEDFGTAKPDMKNYRFFMLKYPSKSYAYIGDNLNKDFITHKYLAWRTICLKDNGQNIHAQNFSMSEEYLPENTITNMSEIINLI